MSVAAFLLLAAITPNDPEFMRSDDSASIQAAVDAAAASGEGEVVIPAMNRRTGEAKWTIVRSIQLPSDMTVVIDNACMVMADGVYENFFRSANVWTEKGNTPAGQLHDIRILGRGRAVLDGGRANDLCEATSCKAGRPHVRANIPIHFVNVRDFEVSGLRIENHRYWGMCYTFCRNGLVRDIRFVAHYDRNNQDGINLRNGCSEITIENISGQTGDDMIALSGIDRPRDDQWNTWVVGADPDIRHICIRNVSGAAVVHPLVAVRAQNGTKAYDITIENLSDRPFVVEPVRPKGKGPRYALVRIGEWTYWSERPQALGEMRDITIRNLDCRYSEVGVVVNGTLQDALIDNVRCHGCCQGALTTAGPGWGGMGATLDNVTVQNVTVDSEVAAPFIVDDAFVAEGDFLRDFRVLNSTLVKAGRRELVERERRDSGSKLPAVKLEAVDNIRCLNGAYLLADVTRSGGFTTAPFHPDQDDPVIDWAAGGCAGAGITVEVSVDGGEFRRVVRAKKISCPRASWLRYRVTLTPESGQSPYLVLMLVGDTYSTRWAR